MRRAFLCLKKGVLCTRLSSVAQRAFSRLTSLDPLGRTPQDDGETAQPQPTAYFYCLLTTNH